MVVSCSARGCKQRYIKKSGISFHTFPRDETEREKWIVALNNLNRKNFKPSDSSKLCCKHFLKEDFVVHFGQRRLRKGAVPSIFNVSSPTTKKKKNKKKKSDSPQLIPECKIEIEEHDITESLDQSSEKITVKCEPEEPSTDSYYLPETDTIIKCEPNERSPSPQQTSECVNVNYKIEPSLSPKTIKYETKERSLSPRLQMECIDAACENRGENSLSMSSNKNHLETCIFDNDFKSDTVNCELKERSPSPQQNFTCKNKMVIKYAIPCTCINQTSGSFDTDKIESDGSKPTLTRNENLSNFGDINSEDLETEEAQRLWYSANHQIQKHNETINSLKNKNDRLVNRIADLKKAVAELKKCENL